MVPGSCYTTCLSLPNPGGRYFAGNPRLSVMLRCLITNRVAEKKTSFAFAGETQEELLTLKEMIEAGKIRPIVDRVYPMAEAALAHQRVETEARQGAVVISVD